MLNAKQKALSMSFVLWTHYLFENTPNFYKTLEWIEACCGLLDMDEKETKTLVQISVNCAKGVTRPLKDLYNMTVYHYSMARMLINPLRRYKIPISTMKDPVVVQRFAVKQGKRRLYYKPWTFYITGKDLEIVSKFMKRYTERIGMP